MAKKTVAKKAEYEVEIKRSRFIGSAFPVSDEKEAEGIIASVRAANRKARHVVYAYIIGNTTGYSDDGEPKKTAGLPIFDYLRKEGLDCVLVTVVRYFGGILLGTGGLVKAYTDAAKGAVTAAGEAELVNCAVFRFEGDYQSAERLRAAVSSYAADISIDYGEKTAVTVAVREEDAARFRKEASELFRGQSPAFIGERTVVK